MSTNLTRERQLPIYIFGLTRPGIEPGSLPDLPGAFFTTRLPRWSINVPEKGSNKFDEFCIFISVKRLIYVFQVQIGNEYSKCQLYNVFNFIFSAKEYSFL